MITFTQLLGRDGPCLMAKGSAVTATVYSEELSTPDIRRRQAIALIDAAVALLEDEDFAEEYEALHEILDQLGEG